MLSIKSARRVRAKRLWVSREVTEVIKRVAYGVVSMVALNIQAAQVQMTAPGSFSVSPTGAATYKMPIQVPPGVGGIEPKLALVYNSQGSNGLLGVGWSLSGLSAITRCPQTKAQDGANWVGGVNYTATDRYCLDGQRLVNIPPPNAAGTSSGAAGVYGADQTYYSTERESFSRIQSYGTAGTAPLAGPSSFKVWTKSGLIMEYGNSTSAKVLAVGKDAVRVWALNKVSDAKGNTMTVTYNPPDTTNGQYYPISIIYTANSTASPALQATNAVFFDYDFNRTDASVVYEGGSPIKTTARLTKVSTAAGFVIQPNTTSASANTLSYVVNYLASAGGGSIVSQIDTCSLNAADPICFPATTTSWEPSAAQANWWTVNNPQIMQGSTNASTWIDSSATTVITGDFNGDGKTDFLLQHQGWTTTQIFLSNGDGTWTVSNQAIMQGSTNASSLINSSSVKVITGDFNGDGRTDFLLQSTGLATTPIFLSNGDGTWTVSNQAIMQGSTNASSWINSSSAKVIVGDFNGDGRTDFLLQSTGLATTPVFLSNGDGTWTVSNQAIMQGSINASSLINGSSAKVIVGDFNGDGKTDFLLQSTGSTTTPIFLSNGDGTWTVSNPVIMQGSTNASTWINVSNTVVIVGDFNGDGKTDFLLQGPGWTSTPIFLSKGDGTWAVSNQAIMQGSTNASTWIDVSNTVVRTGDFNGDGKTDFVLQGPGWTTTPVFLSNGDGTWTVSNLAIMQGSENASTWIDRSTTTIITGEFNGDGRTDFLLQSPDFTTTPIFASNIGRGERMISISNGLSGVNNINYASLAQMLNTRYTRAATVALPQVAVASSWPVVTDVDMSDGVGGTRRTSYWYDSAVVELGTGRGFLGFNWIQTQDVATGLTTRTTFRQDFPYTGMVAREDRGTSATTWNNLAQTSYRYGCIDFSAAASATCPTQQPASTSCVINPGNRYFVFADTTDSANNFDVTPEGQPGKALPGSHSWQVMDNWGNPVCTSSTILNPDGTTSAYSKTDTNVYGNDTTNWFLGKLLRSSVTTTSP